MFGPTIFIGPAYRT